MTSFDYRLNPLYSIKECSSCGALYTTDYFCSVGSLEDKIICDLDKHPTCLNDPLRIVISVDTRLMVIIVKDVLLFVRNLKKIFLHLVSKLEFSKILPSHPMTIPTLLMLLESHSLSIKTPKEEEKQIKEDQAANARYWKIPACYDDDDDDYTIAITPNEPDNSLSMGDEHLDTIPETESDEFIKSSVENLVSIPRESEGEPDDDQSFSGEDFPKEIYSNPLFDEEIISIKTYQHHFNAESDLIESMLNHDSSIISSSKMDSLFDEFAGELTLLKSIPPAIDETDCYHEEETHFIKRLLYDNSSPRHLKKFIFKSSDAEIESFSPSPIPVEDSDSLMEEIDLSFTPNYPMPSGNKEDDYDSERDILILEEFLSNDSLSLLENESFHFDIPLFSRPSAKPPDGNT
uniref:Reverse transcriptase domain-containing protein n=1 Tax=Tanacetum cinerariifolium TaxID=118510 RepID=A0A6L2JFB1_TANCI|nr:hypothetical protein [Tanacetum cinerariifolium]